VSDDTVDINYLIAMSKTRMRERGLEVDHPTLYRWVQRYAPEINKRIRQHLKMSGASFRGAGIATFYSTSRRLRAGQHL
jgi:hypothetical protein